MEVTVRFIPTETSYYKGTLVSSGNKPALCFRGKEKAYGIINEELEISSLLLELKIHDRSPPVLYLQEEYPISKFLIHIEKIRVLKPLTPTAEWLLSLLPEPPEDFPDPVTKKKVNVVKISSGAKKSTLMAQLAEEFEVASSHMRKFLRGEGFGAPYTDERAIRKALKKFNP